MLVNASYSKTIRATVLYVMSCNVMQTSKPVPLSRYCSFSWARVDLSPWNLNARSEGHQRCTSRYQLEMVLFGAMTM